MNRIILLVLLLIAPTSMRGQSLSLFDIDASQFPTIKAKYLAFDTSNQLVKNIPLSDLKIRENGIEQTVRYTNCPPNESVPISSVLIFDKKFDMDYGIPGVSVMKKGIQFWIYNLPNALSETAITDFSDHCELLHDFSTDKNALNASYYLWANGSIRDYNSAFIDKSCGGLNVAQNGKYKRVLILLSSGVSDSVPRTQEIIDFAKQNNVTIFAVILGIEAPQCIKDITQQTGGQYADKITTMDESVLAYNKFLQIASSSKYSEITWESKTKCNIGSTNVELIYSKSELKGYSTYQIPTNSVGRLKVDPPNVQFRNPVLGAKSQQKITITANNFNFNMVNIKSSNPAFELSPSTFSLNAGQSREITVSLIPTDNKYYSSKFEIESDICPITCYANATWTNSRPKSSTLKLTSPNGGEKFIVGNDSVITWEGVPKNETVCLEYSLDKGNSWKLLSDSAKGLTFKWNNIQLPTTTQCLVKVKQVVTENILAKLDWTNYPSSKYLNYSPDGKMIYYTTKYHSRLLDADTWQFIRNVDSVNHDESVCWSPDGTQIATISLSTIKILDAKTYKLIKILSGHQNTIYTICWSPDGTKLASYGSDNLIKIWDINTGKAIKSDYGSNYPSMNDKISWSYDGSKLVYASDELIKIWNINSLKLIKTINQGAWNIAWSIDNTKLYYLYLSSFFITDINTWNTTEIKNDNMGYYPYLSKSPTEDKIVAYSKDSTLNVWDMNTNAKIFELIGHTDMVRCLTWSPDGNRIISLSDTEIKEWDAHIGTEIKSMTQATSDINRVEYSPDSTKIATLSLGNISIYDVASTKYVFSLNRSQYFFNSIAWNPNGTILAIGKMRDGISLLSTNTFREIGIINSNENFPINNISWSPDGQRIAYSTNNEISIWDVKTGKELKTYSESDRVKPVISWSPNGKIIAFTYCRGIDCGVVLCDGDSLNIIKRMPITSIDDRNLSWNPNSDMVAIVGANYGINIWNIKTGQKFKSLIGHTARVYNFVWSPDGNYIASASADSSIKIWNAKTGKIIRTIYGHSDKVNCVSWSPDSKKIVSTGPDYTIKLWNLKDTLIQSDQSDENFSIVKPELQVKDVDLKECIVNGVKDTLISKFIENIGEYQCEIDSIYFIGSDAGAFSCVRNYSRLILDTGANKSIHFSFKPTKVGIYHARITIITQADTIFRQITGIGTDLPLTNVCDTIDFGTQKKGNAVSKNFDLIKNNGNKNVIIKNVYITGENSSDFKLNNLFFPILLKPSDILNANISFVAKSFGIDSTNLIIEFDSLTYLAKIAIKAKVVDNGSIVEDALFEFRESLFNISPNPAKDKITITAKITESNTKIKLIDIAGKVIKEIDCPVDNAKAQDFTIDLTNIPAGMYFIEFKSPNFSQVEKVVVEK